MFVLPYSSTVMTSCCSPLWMTTRLPPRCSSRSGSGEVRASEAARARLRSRCVEDGQREWSQLKHPSFRVHLSYPAITPRGRVVERTDERVESHPIAGDFERVHLVSADSGELYVELVRFPDRSPHDEYRLHRPSLIERFGEDAVTALTETTFGDWPAWSYSFRWDDGERAVLLLSVSRDTYRVIYDPRSELNDRVLRTLTLTE